MPTQVQNAVDVNRKVRCPLHILQQRKDCAAVAAVRERSVKAALAHIGGVAAIYDLRNGGNVDWHRPYRVRHIVIPHEFRSQGDGLVRLNPLLSEPPRLRWAWP